MDKRFAIFAGAVLGVLFVVAGLSWQSTQNSSIREPGVYSTFLDYLDQNQVKTVTIDGTRILGTLKDGKLQPTGRTIRTW